MSTFNIEDMIRIRCDRQKVGSPTLNSQPGAHTGATRKYIPGYSDSNIVFLNTSTGNDANTGASIAQALLTYSAAATAAGSTKKIRLVNSATLTSNINKPTEATIGTSSTISSSLTAPVNTWTQAGTVNSYQGNRHGIAWVPWLSKFICAGGTSKLYSTTDGDTFTAIAGHGFGSSVPGCVSISQSRRLIFIAGTDGKIGYSSDGVTFTVNDIPEITQTVYGIHYDDASDLLVVVGANGMIGTSSDRGITFSVQFLNLTPVFYGVTKSDDLWVVATTADDVYTSSNGYQYTLTDTTATEAWVTVFYSRVLGKFLLGGESGFIYSSANGTSWVAATTPSFGGDVVYGFAESIELGMVVAVGSGGKIAYSSDGDTFTQAATPSYGGSDVYAAGYSPLLGKFITGGASNKAARSTAFANTISAHVAGFSIQAVQYSGTVAAYNCTLKQPGTTAALSLDSCRLTESGAHISNNAQSHFGNLVEGDLNITGVPASQNAVALNCNTITGKLSVFNSSATSYEQIRDNIIESGFYASYRTPMLSGNLRGTNTNGVLSAKVTYSDPVFVDETDYKLKRLTDGESQDSPLVNAAAYYVNEQGAQRDMGAWSYDDTDLPLEYQKTFYLLKPAGNGIRPSKVPAASADQGMDGTWDAVNDPTRAAEYLQLTYAGSVPVDHITAQDYLEALTDLTCEVSLSPSDSDPDTAIVVNGNHSIGDIVLNIDASSTIKSGMVLTISGVKYYILYTSSGASPTKLVLHKPLESAVSDNASITPDEPRTYGTYQYIPQTREIPRPQSHETEYANGASFRFVRQYPQQ